MQLGISEAALASMPPETRERIGKLIANEIREALTTDADMGKMQEDLISLHNISAPSVAQSPMVKMDSAGVGLGPLLALQEIQGDPSESDISPQKETE